jgi:catechol 2,3-dioxygenase-like lactoylglutathione lyase family enzyme
MTSEQTSDTSPTVCWCCGEERGEPELARLECHSEVAVCDVCLDWLRDTQPLRRGNRLLRAIPILATADLDRALELYAALGFETEAWGGGGYGFASRDGVELHLSEVEGHLPATNVVSCYLFVDDADALHAEWVEARNGGRLEAPSDTDYGLREGRHVDPDGNVIRYGSPLPG